MWKNIYTNHAKSQSGVKLTGEDKKETIWFITFLDHGGHETCPNTTSKYILEWGITAKQKRLIYIHFVAHWRTLESSTRISIQKMPPYSTRKYDRM